MTKNPDRTQIEKKKSQELPRRKFAVNSLPTTSEPRSAMPRPYDLEFRLERAKTIERAIANKKLTKSLVAEKTGYDEKTIRNLIQGDNVRDQTVIDVCSFLGIEPKLENDIENVACADDEYGGYLRTTHADYEGFFYLYRRSFSEYGRIYREVVEIKWDDTEEKFVFSDYYDVDPSGTSGPRSHVGSVYMSSYTSLIHFVTTYQGSVRVLTLTRMRQGNGIMRGCLMTQCEDINFFQPTITPIILKKQKFIDLSSDAEAHIKLLDSTCDDYKFAQEQLLICENKVVKSQFGTSSNPGL